MRRAGALLLGALAAAALLPAAAAAHGIVGRADLPIPRWLFGWAAALVLVVSFVALATLWPRPRLQQPRLRRLVRIPVAVDVVAGALGVALFALVVYSGLAGTQTPPANFAPTFVYVVFWVGVPVASALFGDFFRALSPWRAVARAGSWIASRALGGAMEAPFAYPARLGRWPAVLTILAFTWLELAYTGRGEAPALLGMLALAYFALQLAGMSLFGIDTWTDRADGFGVLFNLFSRLSPFERREGVLNLRPPLAGAPQLEDAPGTVALLCTAIGTTTFDGFSQGPIWNSLVPALKSPFTALGLPELTAVGFAFTIGLVGCVLLIGLLYWLGVTGMRGVGEDHDARELAMRFAHTLIPIAFAYAFAHYFSLLAYQGQAVAFLISDPLGNGSDLFGTASATIDYNVIRATGVWYVQVGALVLGHVAGLVLAHDRAVALYREPRAATRSQYWMLLVMVAFTSLGLWLLSAITQ